MLDPIFDEVLEFLHLYLDDDLIDVRVVRSLVEFQG